MQKISVPLAVALLMFPQIVETMYSPALTSIQQHFAVTSAQAGQGMSFFFIAFALGVVFWGRMCDVIGRRQSMLAGLVSFTVLVIFTLYATTFTLFLIGFSGCAFAIAVGSICTQTMIRDSYQGHKLANIFSIIGISIGLSPIVGMLLGSQLTAFGGYRWVFGGMGLIVVGLLIWSYCQLAETHTLQTSNNNLICLAMMMLKDSYIWYISLMVGLFNIALFSYYSIAPFMFAKMALSVTFFGYTAVVLASGSIVGSLINIKLLKTRLSSLQIVLIASVILFFSGVGVAILQHSMWFFMPMALVSLAFGIALPHLLSTALNHYRQQLGSAGALLGLFYYLVIGIGLHCAVQYLALATVLLLCGGLAMVLAGGQIIYGTKDAV